MNKQAFNISASSRALVCAVILGGASIGLSAQVEENDDLDMDVVVQGIRENQIRVAGKMSSWPKVKENIVELPKITYNLIPNKLNVEVEPKLIKPAKVKIDESLKKLYRGYVRAGFGLYSTPLVDVHYMDGRSRNGTFNINYHHLSSAGGVAVDDSIPDGFADNELRLWGKKFMGKHALEAGFDWQRNKLHYYGFDPVAYPETSIEDVDMEQRFNNIDGYLRLTSYFRDSARVNYSAQVMFYNYRDAFNANENNVDFLIHGRKFVGTELFSGDFHVNYNQFQFVNPLDSTETIQQTDNVIVGITPQVSTIHDKWRVNVGMGIYVDARGDQPFHFYPRAEAKYNLISNVFIPYAGVTGDLTRQTYKTISQTNPWIITNPELRATNNKLELYAGVRGTISSNTSFNTRIARRRVEDFAYFVNDTLQSSGNQFMPLYDDISFLHLMGEVAVNTNGPVDLTLRGDYYIYGDLGQQLHPWDQPNTRLTLLGSYNMEDKLIFTAEVYTVGKRKGKSLAPVEGARFEQNGSDSFYTVDLKGFADININAEYRYTKRLSAFVRFNNMLAAKYVRWNNYNVQRFNAMMGVTYAF